MGIGGEIKPIVEVLIGQAGRSSACVVSRLDHYNALEDYLETTIVIECSSEAGKHDQVA